MTNQHTTFEENATKVISYCETRNFKGKPIVDAVSMQIISKMGAIAYEAETPHKDRLRGLIESMLGDILVLSIAQAYASNGIAAEAYKLAPHDKILAFGGAVTALMQSTYCQYRVHASSYDLEKMVLGENPMHKEQFNSISHERAESLTNLYVALRTLTMDFDLTLEECLTRGIKRMKKGLIKL